MLHSVCLHLFFFIESHLKRSILDSSLILPKIKWGFFEVHRSPSRCDTGELRSEMILASKLVALGNERRLQLSHLCLIYPKITLAELLIQEECRVGTTAAQQRHNTESYCVRNTVTRYPLHHHIHNLALRFYQAVRTIPGY
jgi:hypothetical protein